MPHTQRKQAAGMLLPAGGEWLDTQDQALEVIRDEGGFIVKAQLGDDSDWSVFGVYPSQEVFCSNAKTFLKKQLKKPDTRPNNAAAHVAAALKTHTPIPSSECRLLHLTPEGVWFDNETGALTAFMLMKDPDRYMTRINLITQDTKGPAFLDLTTCPPFFGLFKTKEQWNQKRWDVRWAYREPMFPFDTPNELKYDRCRCTLMGIEGALYKAPETEKIGTKEMQDFALANKVILPGGTWTHTKEEALKFGGHTLKWTIAGNTLYSVFSNSKVCRTVLWHNAALILAQKDDSLWRDGRVECTPISSCSVYGHLWEDWNNQDEAHEIYVAIEENAAVMDH